MALSAAQQAVILDRFIGSLAGAAALWDVPGIAAAATATDAWITNNQASFVSALQAGAPAFAGSTTAAQKTLLFCYVLLSRQGLI